MINKTIKFSLFFIIFLGLFSKRNRKYFLFVSIEFSRNAREGLGGLEKAVETHTCGSCSHSNFLVLPNLHLCFYDSIEMWKMFSIS